ncbi:ATP-binding protein, partial [Nocardiopsis sp. TNDT3]
MGEHTGGPGAVTWPDPDPVEPIVGRDTELARLFRAVDSTSTDRVLVLVGDPGTGKSALLGSAARRAEAGGARVLRA